MYGLAPNATPVPDGAEVTVSDTVIRHPTLIVKRVSAKRSPNRGFRRGEPRFALGDGVGVHVKPRRSSGRTSTLTTPSYHSALYVNSSRVLSGVFLNVFGLAFSSGNSWHRASLWSSGWANVVLPDPRRTLENLGAREYGPGQWVVFGRSFEGQIL